MQNLEQTRHHPDDEDDRAARRADAIEREEYLADQEKDERKDRECEAARLKRDAATPETDDMTSMRRATSEWITMCGKLERERNNLRKAMREIVECGLNCKDCLDEAEQMERIAKEALSPENANCPPVARKIKPMNTCHRCHAPLSDNWTRCVRCHALRKFDVPEISGCADEIDALVIHMRAVAARMEYYGGLNAEIVQHGREMDRAADTARGWAKNIRIKNFAAGGGTDEPHLNAEASRGRE